MFDRRDGLVMLANRYELSGVLGVGGMGTVYRARDRELDELVALKVLRRELVAQPGMVERFRREVKLARRVTHRNVARVFDIGEHEGEKFITMELVDGESLGTRLSREGQLPVSDVVALTLAIVEGLGAAHAAGVVHRDLKPDNVLVDATGRVVLTDFGIARAVAYAGQAGRTLGFVVGTPDYMAPEQIENAVTIDGRADLYALGVMLYEMLTGEQPFKGDSALAIITARLVSPPPDPRRLVPELPDAIARLVLRLLARAPAERPASAGEVAALLGGLTLPAPLPRRSSMRPPAPARAPQRIAVVPLATSPESLAWLGYGLSELVADALDGRSGVDVRARGGRLVAVAQRSLEAIGDPLGVPLVIGGSLREEGGAIRGELSLVNAHDGLVLWSRAFGEEARSGPLRIAAAAADEIARTLLLGASPAIASQADEEALASCLRARWEAARGGIDGGDRAIALYERAIARAPADPWINASYALALARRLADTELPGEADDVVTMAELAASQEPALASAHLALAEIHFDRGRTLEAARAVVVARSRAPSSADVERLLGRLLLDAGEIDAALAALRSASLREVPSWRASWDEARALATLGRIAEAESALEAGADAEPHGWQTWLGRARFALWRGDRTALAAVGKQLASSIVAEKELVSVVVDAALGRTSVAAALAHVEACARAAGPSRTRRAFLAQVAIELAMSASDRARAEALLARSADDLGCDTAWLDHCAVLAPLRASDAFARVRTAVSARASAVLEVLRTPHETLPGEHHA
jgi:serine/threonine-protein kinase